MPEYEIEKIVTDVRICLDENSSQSALPITAEYTLQLDDVIRSKIPEAMDTVLMNAPNDLLGDGEKMEPSELIWDDEDDTETLQMCKFKRPDDFLRLVAIKMPDWQREVTTLIHSDEDVYKQQKSKYAALRGTPERPIAAEVHGASGRMLELYTSRSRELEYARYIKRYTTGEASSSVSIPHIALYRPLVYQVAGLTCVTYKDTEHAQVLFGLADGMLNMAVGEE